MLKVTTVVALGTPAWSPRVLEQKLICMVSFLGLRVSILCLLKEFVQGLANQKCIDGFLFDFQLTLEQVKHFASF